MKSNFLVVAALVLTAQVSFGYSINEARHCLEGQTSVCKSDSEMLSSIIPKWKILISKDAKLATTGEAARTVSALVSNLDAKRSSGPVKGSLELDGRRNAMKLQISDEDARQVNPGCSEEACVPLAAAEKLEFSSLQTGKEIAKISISNKQALVAAAPDAALILVFETLIPDTSNAGRYKVIDAVSKKVLFNKIGIDGSITKDGRFVTIVGRISESSNLNMSAVYDSANGFKKVAELKTSSEGALQTAHALGVFCRTSQAAATECVALK